MRNVHERRIAAPAERLTPLFEGLGRDDDRLWPTPVWQPLILDRPLQVGADGGHGPVRYWVSEHPKPTSVSLPTEADLARSAIADPDLVDAWQIPRARGLTADPEVWAAAIFGRRPRWVDALMRLRNAAVRVVGIDRGDEGSFAVIARDDREVLLGSDANHLDFRASILVDDATVTVSTIVRTHNRRGRAYMALVWRLHPAVVRAMLVRARRELADATDQPRPRSAARR